MSDIGQRLRDVDPLACEAGLSTEDVRAVRLTVVAAARETGWHSSTWAPLGVATAIALTVAAAATVERYWPASGDGGKVPSFDPTSPAQVTKRQLQFATPGGTRVIWIFDSKFQP